MTPALVVIAFNRPAALRRLLDSLSQARFDGEVSLVISIDRGAAGIDAEVASIARDYAWPQGEKRVIEREQPLGVVGHFLAAGDLTSEYGDVVLLEDDLTVSPAFHEFATSALDRYRDEARIAAVCLYALTFNGFTHGPFSPLDDGNDVFFLRLPYTQGLAFTSTQWSALRAAVAGGRVEPSRRLHPSFLRFGPDEWFPAFAAYLAASERYVCYPRVSLTTGWGDAGAHFDVASSWFQTPLQIGRRDYRLPPLDDALAVYDSFFELLPDRLRGLGSGLPESFFDIDLHATKARANLDHDFVFTTRPVRSALATYGLRLYPPELNVAMGVPGNDISLAHIADVYWDRVAGLDARRRLDAYYWARRRASRRRTLLYSFAERMMRLRRSRARRK